MSIVEWIKKETKSYQTSLVNPGSFKGHCDAVEEDEGQHYIVKQFMSNDLLAS